MKMKVLIETQLKIEGNAGMRRGQFYVNDKEFKENPDFTVGVIAYEWIQKQKAEFGHRHTVIEKVVWNDQHDITDLVKQIRPIEPPDNLPF
jgi:hypothetical protein